MRLLAQDRLEARAVAIVIERALADTRHAFDRVASSYDRSNAANSILSAMRRRSRATLERFVAPGAHVLDLGCGPGTDVAPLVARGYRVTAIDWSPAMVDEARRRVCEAGLGDRARVEHLGIQQLDRLAPAQFDAVYSSFGPLNCVPDLAAAARAIAARIRPDGVLVASVIGRWCPWEVAFYVLHGRWRRAFARFARGPVAVPLEGGTVWTAYYRPRAFVRLFAAADFVTVQLRTLSLFAPPPYLDAFASRHPGLAARLRGIDDAIGTWPLVRSFGDHFIAVLRRA
jgi:SAM-dependent methyltransferase